MRAYNYCKVCGERNAAGVSNCAACGQPMARSNPVNSSSFRSPTMVIFDIDDTILNVSQRYKDSSRGGYTNKDGSPKKKSTFETAGKARKRAQEFLFSPDNLRKDTAIPGALGLANELAAQGHVIAYVTARNAKFRDVTRNQLEDKGFPIFKDDSDMELLFLKARVGESTPKYKEGVYAKLLASYDVRMVFDDMKENLQAAVSQGITGVYPSIQDYTKYQVKSNPWYTGSDGAAYFYPDEDTLKYGGTGDMDPDADPYDSAASHADPSGMGRVPLENPPLNCGCGKTPCMTYGGLSNPDGDETCEHPENARGFRQTPYGVSHICERCGKELWFEDGEAWNTRSNPGTIQSKVESILVKEGGAAGLKPLKAAFPKGTTKAQATAAIAKMDSVRLHKHGDYILKNPEEYSEDYMVPRDIHRLGKAADSLDDTYDEQDVPEWWKSKLSVTAKDADTLADSLDYVANNPAGVLPMMSGEPSGKHTKLGVVFSEVFIGRNVIKDVGEGIQAIYRGLVGGRTSMAEKRMAMAVASMQKELSDRAKELGGNAVANIKVDYELPQGTASVTIIASADAIKMTRPPKKNPNYSIDEDFERMKQMAYDVRSKEAQGEEVNGREWWNQQIPWIEKRYGTEPLNVTWAMPLNTDGFDPKDKSQEFDDNGVKPLHFLNQLKRIPMTKQPTPERIMQIALNIGQGQASGSVETDFALDDFIIRQNPYPLMGLSVQVKGYRNTAGAFVMKGKKFLILQRSKKETSKHGLWELPGGKVEKGETMRETALIETQEEAGLDVTLKVNLGSHIDDKKKKVYHAFIATPKKGQKVKLSEEHVAHKWVTPEEVLAMPKKKVSHHLRYFLKKEGETIRSNPPKNKIEKGKKLYKHMNGKDPEKIETKKIDMGDVWYQVGEGGCWQIGYMSGKETGKTEQKYTHTFNEETKDGNFPKLYATMPENGKPMLIITGGTWKIRTDDKGVAWIYD